MSLSGFGKNKDESGAKASAPAPSGSGNLTAFIDQGSEFEGKLSFKDTVRIDGRFCGEITSENTLIVGETGDIDATINSTNVVISGAVVGDVTATRQLVLHKSGRLQGNVTTPSLVMEEGAVLNGSITMGRPEAALARSKSKAPEPADRSGQREPKQPSVQ